MALSSPTASRCVSAAMLSTWSVWSTHHASSAMRRICRPSTSPSTTSRATGVATAKVSRRATEREVSFGAMSVRRGARRQGSPGSGQPVGSSAPRGCPKQPSRQPMKGPHVILDVRIRHVAWRFLSDAR